MSKVKVLLVFAFVLVFAAGAVVGVVRDWRPHAPQNGRHPLDEILNLSPSQRDQMKAIWSHVEELHRSMGAKFKDLRQHRDDEIRNLLTPEQKDRYDQIRQDYDRQTRELDGEIDQAVHDAEERTRQILTPQQQAKFDQIRKEHGPHGRGMMRRGRPPTGPSTSPV